MEKNEAMDLLLGDPATETEEEVEDTTESEEEEDNQSDSDDDADSDEEEDSDDNDSEEDDESEDEDPSVHERQSTKRLSKALVNEREGRRAERLALNERNAQLERSLSDPDFLATRYEQLQQARTEQSQNPAPIQVTIPTAPAYPNTEGGFKRMEVDQERSTALLGDLASDTDVLNTISARVAMTGETYTDATQSVLKMMGKKADSYKRAGANEKETSIAKKTRMASLDRPRAGSRTKESRLRADLKSKSDSIREVAGMELLDSLPIN